MEKSSNSNRHLWLAGYVIIGLSGFILVGLSQADGSVHYFIGSLQDIGLALALLCIVSACTILTLLWRSYRTIDMLNFSLEKKVAERTMELATQAKSLEQTNAAMATLTEELRASLKLAENASQSKSNFLANMSHELRTPMNGVLGMSYLLAETPLSQEQQELASMINTSAESLLVLLNDILDFSKIESGALLLENIAFPLAEVLDRSITPLRAQAAAKRLELKYECDRTVPDHLWGDPSRLRQIITNLLSNAIKFTHQGHVLLQVRLQEQEGHEVICLSIEDTGTGIPSDKLDLIFEKFTQADESITRNYGGTGLGLAISRHLVQMMGGKIGVESVVNKGSTFWFTLPLTPATADDLLVAPDSMPAVATPPSDLKPISTARVLLVEDYNVNALFAEKLLLKLGIQQIDKATDGIEAIRLFHDVQYDAIFMDCQMPGLDGYRATEELRQLESCLLRHTPIIAMTANAMVGDREKCLKSGMDDYVSKPIRVQHLRSVLSRWFQLDEDKILVKNSAENASSMEQPIDMEQLRNFSEGDAEEEQALFGLFLDQTYSLIAALEQSTGEESQDDWQSSAHRLKGSAGNLGAMHLYELCKRAELHAADGRLQKVDMLIEIKSEMNRVECFINQLRQTTPSCDLAVGAHQ